MHTEETFAAIIAQHLGDEFSPLSLLDEAEAYSLYYELIKQVSTFGLKELKLGEVRKLDKESRHFYDLNKFFIDFICQSGTEGQKKITAEANQFLNDKKFSNYHYWRVIGNTAISNSLKPEQAEALFCCAAKLEGKRFEIYLRDFFVFCESRGLKIVCLKEYTDVISDITKKNAQTSNGKNTHWWSSYLLTIVALFLVTFAAYYVSHLIEENDMKCINQLSATLSSASDHKTLINFAECKPVIFDELTFPNYTTHYNYAEKYNLISEIIETAKDEQVASDDLSDLYLYRAIYAENMNLTQYMEDLRTAHNLNKHSLPAASLLSLVYREWGHESYKPEFVEDAYWNTERFPWKGNKSFEIVDTSPFSDMTNENFIAYIKSEYESLKDNTDYYSVYLKLEKAKLLIQYFENPTLFEAFKKRHGQCIELNNSMLSASCYEVEMNEALINSDADALVNAYNAGKQKFQQLKGLRGEIRLFIEFQLLQREFTAEEVKRKKIQEIGEEYEYFISSAYENGDTATAIDLKYRYANKIMGLEYQNNVKALSLIKQAIEESERYLSDFQLRNLRLRTGWREYQYGDKDEGINLIGRHLDLIELVQDVPSLLNFLNLAQIYFDENGEDEQAKLSASEKLIDLYFQQNLTLDEELDLVDTLVVVKKFNLALHVLTKIHEKRENSQEVKKYMIKVFVARLLDISSLFSMFSVVPDEVTLESMRSQIKTVEEFAQDLDIPSFNRSEFEENIRTIKSGFGIAPTEPKLSEKEKYIEFLHTNSNLPTDIYTPNEHVHKIVDYWEMELAENTFSAPDFDEAEKRASHFLIELLAPHALEYLSRDGRERQYFYDAISFSEEEIELVKAATEQLKFITEKSKGFPSSEVRMITLVQAAVASYNVRNVDTFNFFVSEAFQKLEHPNYATKFPFENNHNSQLIFLRGRQLMQRCGGYRDAIAVLDEHINLFERFNIPIDPEREYYFNNRKVCIH